MTIGFSIVDAEYLAEAVENIVDPRLVVNAKVSQIEGRTLLKAKSTTEDVDERPSPNDVNLMDSNPVIFAVPFGAKCARMRWLARGRRIWSETASLAITLIHTYIHT